MTDRPPTVPATISRDDERGMERAIGALLSIADPEYADGRIVIADVEAVERRNGTRLAVAIARASRPGQRARSIRQLAILVCRAGGEWRCVSLTRRAAEINLIATMATRYAASRGGRRDG